MNNHLFGNDINSEHAARILKGELSIDEENAINLDMLLQKLNISIVYKEISGGVLGACKSNGLKRLIVINPNIEYLGRKRFTIAHEIGHLILHHGVRYCKKNDFNLFSTKNGIEMQANSFASELLLPKFSLIKTLSKNEVTFDLISIISQRYNTSLTSAAIRLVSISDEPIAIFYHKDGKIQWGIKSQECVYDIEKSSVNSLSIISKLNPTNHIGKGYVDIGNWFITDDDISCFEETIYFSRLNSYLTIAKIEDEY